ncbi:MAG: hypothetical protein ACKO4U_16995 [Caldilinea sp.]
MNKPTESEPRRPRSPEREERMLHLLDYIPQRRIGVFDHLRPQRWNWYLIRRPIERSLDQQAPQPLTIRQVRNLRHFWLDGIFAAASESFYLAFIPLFALAYGATNQQVGWITAIGNLAGAAALFPGARLIETIGHRKETVVWSGGGIPLLHASMLTCHAFDCCSMSERCWPRAYPRLYHVLHGALYQAWSAMVVFSNICSVFQR